MADNQEKMKRKEEDIVYLNLVAPEDFPGIVDNVQQESPKNTVPKFLRKDLQDYPDPVISSEGTFGRVLKVFSAVIGPAALKEPWNVAHVQEEVRENEKRWDRESECIYSLNHHPNIVALYGYVYDAFTDKRSRGLLMEYMHGGSLFDFVEKYVATGKYELGSIVENTWSKHVGTDKDEQMSIVQNTWSKQIALGMNFMHSRNIMHRDLKPNNILLNQTYLVAKIADFGLSRPVDTSGEYTNNIGNRLYTAPEVFNMKYDNSADVWSYGMLLYYIHYLRHPFDTKFFEKKSDRMRYELLVSGGKNKTPLRPTLEEKKIDVIIKQCWESKPEARCSMTDVVNAFLSPSGVQVFPSLAV